MAHLPGHGWRHATIAVEALPFAGNIETVLTEQDISEYRERARQFASGALHVTLGGDRAPEITLERDGDVVEVSVTPSGSDPWPMVRFLIFE